MHDGLRMSERVRNETAATSACSASAPSAAARGTSCAATRRRSRAAPAGRSASTGSRRARSSARAKRTRGVAGVNLTNDAGRRRSRIPTSTSSCELIGGIEPARTLVLEAIANGKHVVTANKALLAQHGNEIFAAAHAKGVMVAFEAAVAGGIPIIKALREGLTANRIEWIAGIINGTSNFILSEMRATRRVVRRPCWPKRRRAATPRPIRRSTSKASTPRTSSRSCRRSRSACRCSSTRPTPKASRKLTQRGHPLRRGARLPDQAPRHHAAHATARASSCACIRR